MAGVVGCSVVGLLVVFPSAMTFSPGSPTFGLNLMARPEPWRLLDSTAALLVVVTSVAPSLSVDDGRVLSRVGGAAWEDMRLGGFDGGGRGAAVVGGARLDSPRVGNAKAPRMLFGSSGDDWGGRRKETSLTVDCGGLSER